MIRRFLDYVVLPRELTGFERSYLNRMNRIALGFFFAHVPVMVGVALLSGTNPLLALVLSTLTCAGPLLAFKTFEHPRRVSLVFGFTAMCMGGLLVHFGQGAMQIEMHFYFFVLIALLAVFANPVVIIVAAVTVALHHLLLYFVLPRSVFNYEASIWAVLVHALFVVLESVAACFVARSFFDNVIGLEKIVERRTCELDARNQDMRLVLENVDQGFATVDRAGALSVERSAIIRSWFGEYGAGSHFWDYLLPAGSEGAVWMQMAWEAVLEDVLPLELAIEQMPKSFAHGERRFEVSYKPILEAGRLSKVLLVISDVTTRLERERYDADQREIVNVFERIMTDRVGFLEFYAETTELLHKIKGESDLTENKRHIHTIKGNCGLFGVSSLAAYCHDVEERIQESENFSQRDRDDLEARWTALTSKVDHLLGDKQARKIEIDHEEHSAVLAAFDQGSSRAELARMITDWKLEPTQKRLSRIADQARAIAARLDKGQIAVDIESNGMRLATENWTTFWSAFAHVVRNAVDHGIESPEVRTSSGKEANGRIRLRTFRADGDQVVVEISDDGKGIDWATLASRAAAAGLPADARNHLVEALFRDGITTKEKANEYSGRGIGMGAMRAACDELGGTVKVTSEPGMGTTVQFWMPPPAISVSRIPLGRQSERPQLVGE